MWLTLVCCCFWPNTKPLELHRRPADIEQQFGWIVQTAGLDTSSYHTHTHIRMIQHCDVSSSSLIFKKIYPDNQFWCVCVCGNSIRLVLHDQERYLWHGSLYKSKYQKKQDAMTFHWSILDFQWSNGFSGKIHFMVLHSWQCTFKDFGALFHCYLCQSKYCGRHGVCKTRCSKHTGANWALLGC